MKLHFCEAIEIENLKKIKRDRKQNKAEAQPAWLQLAAGA